VSCTSIDATPLALVVAVPTLLPFSEKLIVLLLRPVAPLDSVASSVTVPPYVPLAACTDRLGGVAAA